jgi:hypothetical protein
LPGSGRAFQDAESFLRLSARHDHVTLPARGLGMTDKLICLA